MYKTVYPELTWWQTVYLRWFATKYFEVRSDSDLPGNWIGFDEEEAKKHASSSMLNPAYYCYTWNKKLKKWAHEYKAVVNIYNYKYQRHPSDTLQYFSILAKNPTEADQKAKEQYQKLFDTGVTIMNEFHRDYKV